MTHSSLEKLGATPLYPLTEGDASEDIDRDYENWRDHIIPVIQQFIENQQQQQILKQQSSVV